MGFPPATKNMTTAARASTPLVPMSGPLKIRKTTGMTITRKGTSPPRRVRIAVPRRAIQWAR
ncbi:MAG: hypothetical protein H6Q36_502 [Chloroflexi bacterium]|nr:hypothetical protein [Chloroflexota bacterium]